MKWYVAVVLILLAALLLDAGLLAYSMYVLLGLLLLTRFLARAWVNRLSASRACTPPRPASSEPDDERQKRIVITHVSRPRSATASRSA